MMEGRRAGGEGYARPWQQTGEGARAHPADVVLRGVAIAFAIGPLVEYISGVGGRALRLLRDASSNFKERRTLEWFRSACALKIRQPTRG